MEHKKDWGPGYRYFVCEECLFEWKEESRHCESLSTGDCPLCFSLNVPTAHSKHYEWETDRSGNLIDV